MRQKILITTLAAAVLSFGTAATAEPFAYVPNEGGASISVIDVATDKVVDTIKDLGEKPRGWRPVEIICM
ncbi:hypothetical protein [Advenella kashmirensis]|uniref:hypothetical protein n=1 Tax=Advenella kashmirensis TaxID=310575 RepID=UPI001EE667C4|nr:hypothetical protein [Advenella kashmirensis]